MKTKIAAALIATLTLGTAAVGSTGQAQAKGWGWGGVGLGFAAGALIGAAATSAYAGPDVVYVPRCRFVRQFDSWGNYMGTARVCRY